MSDIEEFDSGPGSKTLGLVPHLVMYNLKFICKFACFTLHYRLYMFQISKRKVKKKIQSTCKCSIWTVWPPESPLVPLAPWLKMSLCSSSHLSSSQVHVHVRTPCHTRASRTHTAFREPIQTYQTMKYYIMFFPVRSLYFFTALTRYFRMQGANFFTSLNKVRKWSLPHPFFAPPPPPFI